MKRNHTNLLILFIVSILMISCIQKGSSIKGKVVDMFTDLPVGVDFNIIATTESNIESEQKQVKITATTDSNSEFILRRLIPNKEYTLSSKYPGEIIRIDAPEKGETIILEKEIRIIRALNMGNILMVDDYNQKKFRDIGSLPNKCRGYNEVDISDARKFDIEKIPVFQGSSFINFSSAYSFSSLRYYFDIQGKHKEINETLISKTISKKSIWIKGGKLSIIHLNQQLPSGIWGVRFYSGYYGARTYFFKVPAKL